MSAHTPGPWCFAHRKCTDGMYRTQVFSSDHGVIANCAWTPKPCADGVTETYRVANACLIAAAPDLLEALGLVVDLSSDEWQSADGIRHSAIGNDGKRFLFITAETMELARAAIAKATGAAA